MINRIELENVSFRYGGAGRGVRGIDLSVREGECLVLTGESGCGKTTVTRLINGLAPNYYAGEKTGVIRVGGKDLAEMPAYDTGRMVGSVFQDPGRQFFSSELEGEVAFACENYGLPQDEIRGRTDHAIREMGLSYIGKTPLDRLSGGEKQRAAIASVYALRPGIFVFDEPTANLDPEGIARMEETLLKLKAEGHTLIIAEHRLSWLGRLADRYVYMEHGRIGKEYSPAEMRSLAKEERAAKGLRAAERLSVPDLPPPERGRPAAVKGEEISCKRGKKYILENLNISAGSGSVTAVTGSNGMGKTTAALILSGLAGFQDGRVYIDGKRERGRGLRKAVYYCSNDTGTQFFTDSVSKELLLNTKPAGEQRERARNLLKRMGLYEYKDAHPSALSGGQRQRLAVCCALFSDKNILILDEPTSGLDGRNMRLAAEELRDAAARGKTVLVITHDEEFMAACCDFRAGIGQGSSRVTEWRGGSAPEEGERAGHGEND